MLPKLKSALPESVRSYLPEDATGLAKLTGALQVAGGISLATGIGRRVGAGVLALSSLPALCAANPLAKGPGQAAAQAELGTNVALLGGVLLAAQDTEGKPNLAWRLRTQRQLLASQAAKQKAEVKAAKLAKKNSTNPRDWPWYKQYWQTYKVTAEVDPQLPWLLLGAFAGVLAVFAIVAFLVPPWWMWLLLGVFGGITAAMWVLLLRAKKATYTRYAGQPGSAEVALSMLDGKKWFHSSAIAATRQLDAVHRAVGPAGIVLIGEGSASRVKPLLASEAKKHEQVAYGVPVTTIVMGDGEGEVPLDKLAGHLKILERRGLIALTRFSGDIGFYPDEYLEIIRTYMGK